MTLKRGQEMKAISTGWLAIAALVPAAAAAQTVSNSAAGWSDVANVPLAIPQAAAGAGVSWQQPQVQAAVMPASAPAAMQASGGFIAGTIGAGISSSSMLRAGARLAGHWLSSRFRVRDHRRYGFADSFHGGHWVRVYNDAVLIDGGGRIYDVRRGLDWDRYGDRWSDRRGIPEYVGDGDYHPDDRDHAWVRSGGRGYAGGGYPPVLPGYGQAMPGPYVQAAPSPYYGYAPMAGYSPQPAHQPGCSAAPAAHGTVRTCVYGGQGMPGYGWGTPVVVETTVTTTTTYE